MRSSLTKKVIKSKNKHFNKDMVNGVATKLLPQAVEYLNGIIENGIKNLNIPLEYKWRLMTPYEDFKANFKPSSKAIVDVSKSTLYRVEMIFTYNGTDIRRTILLPFVEKGGILYLSDAVYSVVPVLTEYVIAPTNKEVFVRLLKDKLIFKRMERNIVINGQKRPIPVIVSNAYKFVQGTNNKIPMALYMFLKNGFYGAFEKYFNTRPIITDRELAEKERKKYAVFESTGRKPRMLNDTNYIPHNIKILVEKDKVNPFMETVIASLIYSFDLINVYSKNLLKILAGKSKLSEKTFWKVLLGKIIFKNKYTIDKIMMQMDEYVNVINTYMDPIIEKKLKENNILVEDFYDLIAYIIKNYQNLVMNADVRSSSIENRYIDILYYILYDLIEGINRVFHGINIEYNKKGDKFTAKDIEKLLNKHFSTRKIFSIIKSGGVNISLMPVDYSGDNYFSKITSVLED